MAGPRPGARAVGRDAVSRGAPGSWRKDYGSPAESRRAADRRCPGRRARARPPAPEPPCSPPRSVRRRSLVWHRRARRRSIAGKIAAPVTVPTWIPLLLNIADHDRPSTREAPLAKAALVAGRQRDNSRAHAREAPDDYFGRQLREAASDETKRCADIAAKREAAAQK